MQTLVYQNRPRTINTVNENTRGATTDIKSRILECVRCTVQSQIKLFEQQKGYLLF